MPRVGDVGRCKNCNIRAAHRRGRTLCQRCDQIPEVRALHPLPPGKEKFSPGADTYAPKPLPSHSTDAPIGSQEKIDVMNERFARGEQLHHPDDTTLILAEPLHPFEGTHRAWDGTVRPG